MTELSIVIERNGDAYVTSYDIWAKRGVYPQDSGDGVFVGSYTIQPSEDSITETWESPNDGTWYFGAISIYNRNPGAFFQLNGT